MVMDIRVTEILSRLVTVEAESEYEALEIVEEMYRNEEIVLDHTDFKTNVIIEKNEKNFISRKDFLIDKLVDYMIKDEEKHYEELDKPKDHIYLTLKELNNSL